MRRKLLILLLAVSLTLAAAGCTPATEGAENTSSQDTTMSVADQAAAEAPKEETTIQETSMEVAPNSDVSVSFAEPPTPSKIQPADPPADEGQPNEIPSENPRKPVGYYSPQDPFFFPFDFPESTPPAPNNAGSPEDYISVEYNVSDLAISAQSYGGWCINFVGKDPITIGQFNHAYPMECLRQVDENTFYAVYKVEQGGYFYVHFQRILKEPFWAKNPPYNGSFYNGAIAMTGYSYVTEKRSSTDYAEIVIGDSNDKLAAIDSAMAFWKFHYRAGKGYEIRQYLTDGMLTAYCSSNGQGDFVIEEKAFYPGSIRDYETEFNDSAGIVVNTAILPQDFPQ